MQLAGSAKSLRLDRRATLIVRCDHASEPVQQLGEDESYRLEITPQQALLVRAESAGRAARPRNISAAHCLHAAGLRSARASTSKTIRASRGAACIWTSRGIGCPSKWSKRNLDGMAAVKLNVFHWHLSDDQGFRVESKRFPKLQQLGSDGLYYTQEQIRDVIAYARDRGIRVVPEFDMPGHTTSWLVGYPQLASAPGPYQIERNWGVFDPTMDPTRESTYQFLDAFIGEMAALFPDAFFHIGGDEVTGKQWKSSARIRAFMRKNRLKSTDELQAYFNRRLQKDRGEARQAHGRLGRDPRSGFAEGHRHSILARPEVAGRSCAARLFGHPFGRLLPRPHGARLHALCGGPAGWRRRLANR